jgi:hypothetical protein
VTKRAYAWCVCIGAVALGASACSSGGKSSAATSTTRLTTGRATTVLVARGLRYHAPAAKEPLRELTSGRPIGWRSLGGECLDDGCKFAAAFTSPTGKSEDEEAWLTRLVTRRSDGTPVWELLDRYHAQGSPWALHSAWECHGDSGRSLVTVAGANGDLRFVLDVDRENGLFVRRASSGFRCGEIEGDSTTTAP